ncbi:MAG: geranylgeranylglyceryl/heptaprenylglyceryl phosphate synthase [Prevotellaceae bacterium]|jgi:putative glycerol-1-phosphate prenyltransferase|nr:geranylgeranylglyceryl/heptaprenylglyceryl phosphate synthase [Prevotellaceae bacterium]
MTFYKQIQAAATAGKKLFAVLVDPDKCAGNSLPHFAELACTTRPDFIFIGGSLTAESTDKAIAIIKQHCDIPVILFPGSAAQFSPVADAILYLSLISGRNADFLIGQHVLSAPFIRHSGIETISTGYMLIESASVTAVEYMSNTRPIPRDKPDIAVATAIAGELLGNRLIYLEAGSGASLPIPAEVISAVKKNISVPLIVGGGLRSESDIRNALGAGADIIVVGNMLEKQPEMMLRFSKIIHEF